MAGAELQLQVHEHSERREAQRSPPPTIAPSPEELPPAVRSVSHGFKVSPHAGLPPPHVSPSCVMLVLAKTSAPARRSLGCQIQGGITFLNDFENTKKIHVF